MPKAKGYTEEEKKMLRAKREKVAEKVSKKGVLPELKKSMKKKDKREKK